MSTRQYQPLAAPFVPTAGAETITVDKWFPQLPGLVRRKPNTAILAAAQAEFGAVTDVPVEAWTPTFSDRVPPRPRAAWFQPTAAAPLFVPDVTQPVTALAWKAFYPDLIHPLKGLNAALQRAWQSDRFDAPGQVVVPDLAKSVYPDRVFGRGPLTPHPSWIEPYHVPDVTQPVTALSWRAQYPDRLNPPARVAWQSAWHSDRFDPPNQVIAPDLAKAQYPDRVYGRQPLTPHPSWAAPLYVADVTVIAPAMSWNPRYPHAIDRKTFRTATQRALFWDTSTPIDIPDLAKPVYPDRIYRDRFAAANQKAHSAPLYVPDVTVVAPSHAGWRPIAPDWIARRLFHASQQQVLAWNSDTPAPTTFPAALTDFFVVSAQGRWFMVPTDGRFIEVDS